MHTRLDPLIEHLESYFGRIETGWAGDGSGDREVQVAEFRNGKIPGVIVLSTLGLSSFALRSEVSGKPIRQELFVMIKTGQLDPRLAAVIDQIATERVRTNAAVLRGEVLSKEGKLLDTTEFVALYATLPVYYPREFWQLAHERLGDVAFCWLLPITATEQSYIQNHGWSAFEDLVDKAEFDLFDLQRQTII